MIDKKAKSILTKGIIWIVLLAILSWFVFPWGQIIPERKSPMREQWLSADFLTVMSTRWHIRSSIMMFEHKDTEGRYTFKAILSPSFEKALPKMVEAYNSDPSTDKPVSEDYVRFYYTEGIGGAAGNYTVPEGDENNKTVPDTKELRDGCYAFNYWLKENANLVYIKPTNYRYPNYTEDGVGYINEPGDVDKNNPPSNDLLIPNVEPGDKFEFGISNYTYLLDLYGNAPYTTFMGNEYYECLMYEWEYKLQAES